MAYADLTTDQKADIAKYDTFLRSLAAGFCAQAKAANAAWWAVFAQSNVDPILATLADDDVIPNSTGYAGAKPLTVAEFKALQALARGMQTYFETNIALAVKAVGVNA